MKFKPGNIVEHTPTKTKWIVLDVSEWSNPRGRYSLEVDAMCIYVGTHKRAIKYWKVHERDIWALTDQDLYPTDSVWKVEYDHEQHAPV